MKRGFTLTELLVVMFLSIIVLFLVGQLVIPSLLLFNMESAATEAQQGTFILMGRLRQDLLNTEVDTVTISQDPVAISFQEVEEAIPFDSTTGLPNLENRFTVYYWNQADQVVYRRTWPPNPPDLGSAYDFSNPTRPLRLTPDHLRTITEQPNDRLRVIARNVSEFVVEDDDADPTLLHPPFRVKVTCTVNNNRAGQGDAKVETATLETKIMPRNVRW